MMEHPNENRIQIVRRDYMFDCLLRGDWWERIGEVEEGERWKLGGYSNNNKSGKWLTYYKNGQLMTEINFVDGQRDGQAKSYDKKGKLVETTLYKNGEKQTVKQ
jgi:hypothetical protein